MLVKIIVTEKRESEGNDVKKHQDETMKMSLQIQLKFVFWKKLCWICMSALKTLQSLFILRFWSWRIFFIFQKPHSLVWFSSECLMRYQLQTIQNHLSCRHHVKFSQSRMTLLLNDQFSQFTSSAVRIWLDLILSESYTDTFDCWWLLLLNQEQTIEVMQLLNHLLCQHYHRDCQFSHNMTSTTENRLLCWTSSTIFLMKSCWFMSLLISARSQCWLSSWASTTSWAHIILTHLLKYCSRHSLDWISFVKAGKQSDVNVSCCFWRWRVTQTSRTWFTEWG